jgi:uncharacterized RDD family membrane protein YckC
MQRYVPYLLALLFAGLAPNFAQQQPANDVVIAAEAKPADDRATDEAIKKADEAVKKAEDDASAKKADDDDTTEAVVENHKVRDRRRGQRFETHHKTHPDNVQVRADVSVKKGETSGDIVVVAGTLNVEGEVDGNIVAVATKAYINGPVRGTVVVVPGPVKFGPDADIRDETVAVGQFQVDPGAKFGRRFQPVPIPELVPIIAGAKDFVFEGLLLLRPLPPSVRWVWIVHGVMLLILVGMTLLFPKPVAVGAKAISERPVVSMFSGFLTAILFVPLLALLVVTVIGIVAVPFAIAGLFLAALFGKASVLEFVGQQVGRNLRVAIFESPLLALLIGAVILALFYMVPVLGLLVWCVATLLGLGAIMVATASTLNNQPTIPTPTGVPITPAPVSAPVTPIPAVPVDEPASAAMASVATAPVLLRRVGFWKRAFAAFLDWVLLAFALILCATARLPIVPLLILLPIFYFVGMWTWKGTSVGKICLGLKIVRTDGAPIDFAVALVRSLAAFFSCVVVFLGYFWAGWDKEKQSWHDKIAGTVVVQVPKGVSLL